MLADPPPPNAHQCLSPPNQPRGVNAAIGNASVVLLSVFQPGNNTGEGRKKPLADREKDSLLGDIIYDVEGKDQAREEKAREAGGDGEDAASKAKAGASGASAEDAATEEVTAEEHVELLLKEQEIMRRENDDLLELVSRLRIDKERLRIQNEEYRKQLGITDGGGGDEEGCTSVNLHSQAAESAATEPSPPCASPPPPPRGPQRRIFFGLFVGQEESQEVGDDARQSSNGRDESPPPQQNPRERSATFDGAEDDHQMRPTPSSGLLAVNFEHRHARRGSILASFQRRGSDAMLRRTSTHRFSNGNGATGEVNEEREVTEDEEALPNLKPAGNMEDRTIEVMTAPELNALQRWFSLGAQRKEGWQDGLDDDEITMDSVLVRMAAQQEGADDFGGMRKRGGWFGVGRQK